MENTIFNVAKSFIERAKLLSEETLGRNATEEEINLLKQKFGSKLPDWYCFLISELPLIHMEIGWQADEPEDDYDGVQYIEILAPKDMIDESYNAYPGIPILDKGYICIGGDLSGLGDPYFINFNHADYPVFQVYHDSGEQSDVILSEGREKVTDSLKEFFQNGIISK